MNIETKTYSAEGRKVWTVVLIFALAILAVGLYLGFIKSKGFVKSTGVIVSLREDTSYDSDMGNVTNYYPIVKHYVDGREYTGVLDISTSPNSIGEEVRIQYDPENPSDVNSYSPAIVIYIFVVGFVLLILAVYKLFFRKNIKIDD